VAVIPAGKNNLQGHPREVVLQRLRERHIPFRYPAEDGWCGAKHCTGTWRPFP
jgi:beta-lactamase superfamily II metal-dependent hydrolase